MYVLTTTHLLLFYLLYHDLMELFLRSKYEENLQDLDGELCKEWLMAMFHYQRTGEVLENINLWVKSILRQQIKEREWDKKNYDDACEKQRLKALKRWHPEEYKSIQQNATVCHGIPQNANSNSNNNIIIKEENIKEENELREDWKRCYYWNVWLKDIELERLNKEYWSNVIEEYIIRLSEYIDKKWDSYTDHNKTIRKRLAKWNVKKKSERVEEWDKPHDFSKDNVIYPVRKRAWEIQK